ncbi:GLIPR1-like protein 1 [Pleurodeles waltl]|uniref:GLIPR1-like protein 1 n=1 Tax=Pleurodeles waltl TaxID=8319 RepID=UPI003709513A
MVFWWPLLSLVLLVYATPGLPAYVTPPNFQDPEFIQKCLYDHNSARALVSPPATNMQHMSWDTTLASTAQAWAEKCIFDHNVDLQKPGKLHPKFSTVGENIWIGGHNMQISPTKLWVSEKKDYHYNTNRCFDVCGHYTQVVWANTYKVGCGAHFCPNVKNYPQRKDMIMLVCNYGPAGNNGQQPYTTGDSCSKCSAEDGCKDNLCVNPDRDGIEGHGTGEPGAEASSARSSFCSASWWLALMFACLAAIMAPCGLILPKVFFN